ncbi:MAG: 1-acyl-sn-glycerol-3-phosphate acyltransferase [Gammaproteobacteria bacterium]|nr:1-acyl-sn-glycerol-3-phosphate acyltransferase [Gammaproteobacteria bacterium]
MSAPLEHLAFQKKLQQMAMESGLPFSQLRRRAAASLDEMHAARNGLAIRMFGRLSRFMYSRGYDPQIIYDTDELATVRELAARQSVVYLVTHKTYLDFFVLFDFLRRHGINSPYIFGGINVALAGLATLARRAGCIFIRRTFRDDNVYKAVLQRYVASLLEDDQSFTWAIEGTRSRTGKLVLPKLGLLKYVVDASEKIAECAITYIPVCVAYDQIPDIIDMSAQEAGAEKTPESVKWFLGYIRKTGGHFGNIYVRFGDAVTLEQTPDAPSLAATQIPADPHTIEIEKLAFEVCYRINEVTPVTETSLALMSLLCQGTETATKLHADVALLQHYIRTRQSSALFQAPSRDIPLNLDATLASLVDHGIVHTNETSDGLTYSIEKGRYLVALYYSNMAVHHFVIAAFTEIGLLSLSKKAAASRADFEHEMLALRELFKFEFFFARKDRFRQQFIEELAFLGTSFDELIERGADFAAGLLRGQLLLVAESVLRPYLDAYHIVATMLLEGPADVEADPATFVLACQQRGRQNILTGIDGNPHVAPRALLTNGYELAKNRGLLRNHAEIMTKRQRFAAEIEAVAAKLDQLTRLIN